MSMVQRTRLRERLLSVLWMQRTSAAWNDPAGAHRSSGTLVASSFLRSEFRRNAGTSATTCSAGSTVHTQRHRSTDGDNLRVNSRKPVEVTGEALRLGAGTRAFPGAVHASLQQDRTFSAGTQASSAGGSQTPRAVAGAAAPTAASDSDGGAAASETAQGTTRAKFEQQPLPSSAHSVSGRTLSGLAYLKALWAEYPKRGFWGTLMAIRTGRVGMYDTCLVGVDEFGNRYYENRAASYMRDRWCEYRDGKNADPVCIPPEWHAWLHHFVDDPPVSANDKWVRPLFVKPPHPNYSGTSQAYAPRNSPRSPAYIGHLATSVVESWQAQTTLQRQRKPRALTPAREKTSPEPDQRLDLP
jgi:NADH:ubiquinone oxidoreductase subunit